MNNPGIALGLVVVQTTSQCNLNCGYCYIPTEERKVQNVFNLNLIEPLFSRIFESPFVSPDTPITVLWHDGEPLLCSIEYYQDFISRVEEVVLTNQQELPLLKYEIQTNGTLLNDRWCVFIKENKINVGISCDGPDFVHDTYRKRWNGAKTAQDVEKAFQLLAEHDIQINALATITPVALQYLEEFYHFFKSRNVKTLGLNFVKQGGNHTENWLQDYERDCYSFLEKLFWLYLKDFLADPQDHMVIREFYFILGSILGRVEGHLYSMSQAFSSISIAASGHFSTFAPALLFEEAVQYEDGNFFLGNFCDEVALKNIVAESSKLQAIHSDIQVGIQNCREQCEYFEVCGGQLAAHKYGEHKNFQATETQYCRITVKMVADIALKALNECFDAEQQSLKV